MLAALDAAEGHLRPDLRDAGPLHHAVDLQLGHQPAVLRDHWLARPDSVVGGADAVGDEDILLLHPVDREGPDGRFGAKVADHGVAHSLHQGGLADGPGDHAPGADPADPNGGTGRVSLEKLLSNHDSPSSLQVPSPTSHPQAAHGMGLSVRTFRHQAATGPRAGAISPDSAEASLSRPANARYGHPEASHSPCWRIPHGCG